MDTEEKILASALDVFIKHGFSASTTLITQNAGVSTGILFHYFPTKKDLILFLYSQLLVEYYQHVVNWSDKYIRENDPKGYYDHLRDTWNRSIDWGLQGWHKFQYIQLFESSVLADQFSINNNKEYETLFSEFIKMTALAVKFGYLKDLPTMYLVDITRSLIASTTEYLHTNIQNPNDPVIREKFWRVYCDMVMS
jgi:AcrR family transcriptional regulator